MASPCVILKLGKKDGSSTIDLVEKLIKKTDKQTCVNQVMNHLNGIVAGITQNESIELFVASADFDPKQADTYANFSGSVLIEGGVGTVTGECDDVGIAGNVTLTGDGTSTVAELAAEEGNFTFSAGGSLIPESAEEIEFTGGLDAVEAAKTFQKLTYTAVTAGVDGNDIDVVYVADGTAGAETVAVVGTTITVHIGVTGTKSTSNQVKAAVNADEDASALVIVTGGDDVADQVAVASPNKLTDGADAVAATFTSAAVNLVDYNATFTVVADDTGAASNVTLTGDGTSTLQELIDAETPDYTVSAGGDEVLKLAEEVEIAGGLDDISTYVVDSVTY